MAPSVGQQKAEQALQESIGDVTAQIGKISDNERIFMETVSHTFKIAALASPLTMFFRDDIENALRTVAKSIGELKDVCTEFVDHGFPVFSLIRVGFGWTELIMPDLSGMVGTARDLKSNALHEWQGTAAQAYREKRAGQWTAIKGTSDIVRDTGAWLISVAALNTKFFIDLFQPLLDLVESLIEGIAEAASVAGLLEAIDTVADAAANALMSVIDIAKLTVTHTLESTQLLNQALTIVNNNDCFPAKGWPQAVNR